MPAPIHRLAGRGCEPYQADLAAFIDLEIGDPAQAAAAYPHVWWHLWTCSTCSQAYEFIHILLGAERSGELPTLRLPPRPPRHGLIPLWQIALKREMLRAALPLRQARLAVTRGSRDEGYVIYDEVQDEPEYRQITVVVREQPNGGWQLIANVSPPPDGVLVVSAGPHRFVAPFAPDGRAVIEDIAAEVLVSPDAPSLQIVVVPSEEG